MASLSACRATSPGCEPLRRAVVGRDLQLGVHWSRGATRGCAPAVRCGGDAFGFNACRKVCVVLTRVADVASAQAAKKHLCTGRPHRRASANARLRSRTDSTKAEMKERQADGCARWGGPGRGRSRLWPPSSRQAQHARGSECRGPPAHACTSSERAADGMVPRRTILWATRLDHHDHRPASGPQQHDAVGLRTSRVVMAVDAVGLGHGIEDQRWREDWPSAPQV